MLLEDLHVPQCLRKIAGNMNASEVKVDVLELPSVLTQ
jgi:hypothetical protein